MNTQRTPSETVCCPLTCSVVLVLLLFFALSLQAQNHSTVAGMSSAEAESILGAPEEKLDFESLRQQRWNYKDFSLLFEDGKVKTSSPPLKQTPPAKIANSDPSRPAQERQPSSHPFFGADMDTSGFFKDLHQIEEPDFEAKETPSRRSNIKPFVRKQSVD